MILSETITKAWYEGRWWLQLLRPLSWLYRVAVYFKKQSKLKEAANIHHGLPIVVVGNVTVGGTGKTPLVIYLLSLLRKHGYHPGVVSRGYGGSAKTYPREVDDKSFAHIVGDESIVVHGRTRCPMVVDPNRNRAIKTLISRHNVDVIICDDGLQHYAMPRDIEIAVIDSKRRLGNGLCLPAGPLREPAERLDTVDFIVVNGKARPGEHQMKLEPNQVINLNQPILSQNIEDFAGERVHAVAGIGNPQRFFNLLSRLNLDIIPHAYPDHYAYEAKDLDFSDGLPVIMTEKDMVKCTDFAQENWWYLSVDAHCDKDFDDNFLSALLEVKREQNAT